MDFGIAGVAAITVIAYAAGQAMKAWGRGERWIPTVCAVLGGILGVVGLYVMPGFPANDVITPPPSAWCPGWRPPARTRR